MLQKKKDLCHTKLPWYSVTCLKTSFDWRRLCRSSNTSWTRRDTGKVIRKKLFLLIPVYVAEEIKAAWQRDWVPTKCGYKVQAEIAIFRQKKDAFRKNPTDRHQACRRRYTNDAVAGHRQLLCSLLKDATDRMFQDQRSSRRFIIIVVVIDEAGRAVAEERNVQTAFKVSQSSNHTDNYWWRGQRRQFSSWQHPPEKLLQTIYSINNDDLNNIWINWLSIWGVTPGLGEERMSSLTEVDVEAE